ncbi:flavodoxin family protein [Pseudomonas viridiflava]|uniref:flavodoxin family protein n=1 Tax=Pseudomonas viridiflava TaxID=33069 RepID=UPI00197C904D|nr:hypothetical protein [Pseudomonas viridiflava]
MATNFRLRKYMLTLAAVAITIGLSAFTTMVVKDRTYVASEEFTPTLDATPTNVVVYYSRSGHSEAVAREVARKLNAPIAKIAADYPLDFRGQRKAVSDAESKVFPPIKIAPVDLSSSKRVYMVAPTWMFRPAPPLWTFVRQTDLTAKEVVLVLTGNSRFKQEEIEAFSRLVEAQGGRLLDSIFIRRGRIYWQMNRTELLQAVDTRIDTPVAKP